MVHAVHVEGVKKRRATKAFGVSRTSIDKWLEDRHRPPHQA
ncbi:MAG: hypothetical protein K8S99_09045 [Planctomycetes bacterium]|nr:hypothetical protein [Planctomycetota bacterium]